MSRYVTVHPSRSTEVTYTLHLVLYDDVVKNYGSIFFLEFENQKLKIICNNDPATLNPTAGPKEWLKISEKRLSPHHESWGTCFGI